MTIQNIPEVEVIEPVQALWGSPLQPAGCQVCGQVHLVDASRLGQPCPNCMRGKLASQPALLRPEPPELLAPFHQTQADLLPIFTKFIGGVWLRPDDFTPDHLLHRTVPVFWPMWLVDSDLTGEYQAEVGFDYQVKSSQDTYAGGGWRTQSVLETRIRWEPRLGQLKRHYDNVAVPALTDHQDLLKLVGSYRRDEFLSYEATQLVTPLGQAALRVPDLQPDQVWSLAQAQLNQAASGECAQAAGGQHIRNFTIQADYQDLHWTQLLQPLYVSYYLDDDGQPHPVYVNGQTGRIGGVRLASQRKGWRWFGILAIIALLAFMLGMLGLAAGTVLPPLAVIAPLLIILAFIAGAAALIPAIYPWQWNRGQK